MFLINAAWRFRFSVLPGQARTEIYLPALPALVRLGTAFPPLVDDIVGFLVQLGRICLSQSCLQGSHDHRIVSCMLRQMDRTLASQNSDDEGDACEGDDKRLAPAEVGTFVKDIKRELKSEEGELEEGELPDTKTNVTTVQSNPSNQKHDDSRSDKRLRKSQSKSWPSSFGSLQIHQLFKTLPESSIMGAEVYRAFAQLCDKAILHKSIY